MQPNLRTLSTDSFREAKIFREIAEEFQKKGQAAMERGDHTIGGMLMVRGEVAYSRADIYQQAAVIYAALYKLCAGD